MKKLFRNLMLMAMTAITFTACEDVPAPYEVTSPGSTTVIPGGTGAGTVSDPYNAISALNLGSTLAAGEESTDYIYIKGTVVSVKEEFTSQYGNGTFYISEDGTAKNQFYAYRVLYMGNKKYSDADPQIKVGDEVIVCAKITNFNGTIETAQNKGFLYALNGVNRGGEPQPSTPKADPTGEGTLASPYNVSAVLDYINTLGTNESDKQIYVKGKVSQVKEEFTTQYGNGTFCISDDGTQNNEFTAYRVLYLGNKKYADGQTQIKVGDEVIVCGNVVNYRGNTPETVQGKSYLYSLNGETGAGDTPGTDPTPGEAKGTGTLADPYNSVAANNAASALEAGAESDADVYIKGKIVSIKEQYGTQYGNASFYISDDGTTSGQFYVFRALYLGNVKYTTGLLLKEGDEVVICGRLTNYRGDTPETAQGKAYLYSLNGSTEVTEGGDDPTPDPTPEPTEGNLLANGDFETWADGLPVNWKTASTAGNATLTQSTDARNGSYSVSVGFNTTTNKRLGYKELNLKAGTYTFSFYAKSTTAESSQTQAGYVDVVDGRAGSYKYGGYVSLNNTSWTLVSTTFTLTANTTVSLVMMNPKTSSYATAQDILVDDATLATEDGGIE